MLHIIKMVKSRGGDSILGEGSFGCVVEPPVPCDGKEVPFIREKSEKAKEKKAKTMTVGKIYATDEDFHDELVANKIAATVDPTGKLLLIPQSYCKVSYGKIMDNPVAQKCKFHGLKLKQSEEDVKLPTDFYQISMPYGGKTLEDVVFHKKMTLYNFLNNLKPVFQALILLEEKKYCHQDIKTNNILIKPNGETILIDYSYMRPNSEIYAYGNYHRLKKNYFPYPPEMNIYANVHYNKCYELKACDYIIHAFRNQSLPGFDYINLKAYESYFPKEELYRILRDCIKRYIKLETGGKYKEYMNRLVNKIDVYSLGCVFIDCSSYLDMAILNNDKKKKLFKAFVKKWIHPDPDERYSAKKLYAAIQQILSELIK